MGYRRWLASLLFVSGLTACGGGGGNSSPAPVVLPDGMLGSLTGTVSTTQLVPTQYGFAAAQNHAYSARLVSATGDADLYISNTGASATVSLSSILDYSVSIGVDDVSFIVPSTRSYYALVDGGWAPTPSSTYSLKIYHNHLTVGGPTRTRTTKTQPIYFSFNAVAGQAYNVKVTPSVGDPSLSVYSGTKVFNAGLVPDTTTLVGQSTNVGATQPESVVFVASQTKTYYFQVTNTNTAADMTFSASVEPSTAAADLQVSVNSLTYSNTTGNLTVNYTVSNTGAANSSNVNLHFWVNSATPPAAGSVGDDWVSIAGVAQGGTYTASRTIPGGVGALTSGTLYAYVDPENALVEADETNNVSAGKPWALPVLAPQAFNFEDSLTPAVLIPSGDAPWSVVPGGTDPVTLVDGASNYSFASGTLTANQTSCFQVSTNGARTVKFNWKALTDTTADSLAFYVNGWIWQNYTGANAWTAYTYTTGSTGLNTFKWCYAKGAIDNAAVADGGWVDNIEILPEQPDLTVKVVSVSSSGTNLTISYTVTNNTAAAAAATTVDFWANSPTVPTVGTLGDVQVNIPVIAGFGSYHSSITVPSILTNGTVYALVDTNNTVSELNETNNVSTGKTWTYSVPLASYDFENGLFPPAFVIPAAANAGWQIDATNASTGTQSIRSITILDSQTACSELTVANSSNIAFDWKVSSETWDYLRFYIDTILQVSISGSVNWAEYTLPAALTLGTHTFKWCYEKDLSVASGTDAGWVDNIRVY